MLLWLRAAGLVGQTVPLGSAVFALLVLRPARDRVPPRAFGRTVALTGAAALLAALAQTCLIAVQAAALADATGGWPTAALLGSTVGLAGLVRVAAGLAVVAAALAFRRAPESRARGTAFLAGATALCLTGV